MNKERKNDIIFGIRSIIEAIKEGKTLNKVLIQKGLKGDLFKELIFLLKKHSIIFQNVPIQKLNYLTKKNHQGVVAFTSPVPYHDLDLVIQSIYERAQDPFILVLDRIKDVRNFGAIARTAECLGVHAIVIPNKDSALITSDAIKTSAGALFKLPVCKVNNLQSSVVYIKSCGLKIFACTEKSKTTIDKIKYSGPSALIMGSEQDGINKNILDISDFKFKIPMQGEIASLNVSVACGIAIFELLKT